MTTSPAQLPPPLVHSRTAGWLAATSHKSLLDSALLAHGTLCAFRSLTALLLLLRDCAVARRSAVWLPRQRRVGGQFTTCARSTFHSRCQGWVGVGAGVGAGFKGAALLLSDAHKGGVAALGGPSVPGSGKNHLLGGRGPNSSLTLYPGPSQGGLQLLGRREGAPKGSVGGRAAAGAASRSSVAALVDGDATRARHVALSVF